MLIPLVVTAAALIGSPPVLAAARAGAATKAVRYHGLVLRVPASWPVFDLGARPATCVRFDRHAVYLGDPGADERCPPVAAGRTEAILVVPGRSLPAGIDAGHAAVLSDRAARVTVLATWGRDRATVSRALGVASLAPYARAALRRPAAVRLATAGRAARERVMLASPAGVPARPGEAFSGLGFDACSTPSPAVMGDWGSSPFGAIGIYIGGANMACAQPNLSAAWVSAESAAGWHLIPIYVGLQAPGNSCGCAPITSASAATEGAAAAVDAVAQAQALGIGTGNPIVVDMEAYSRNSANTPAVLAFLGAWTAQLHAAGYRSGVYSSEGSGIADLVSELGSPFAEPDELWIANWNGVATTDDAVVPSTEWVGERMHQYASPGNVTYGGATINIDENAVDATLAAAGTAGAAAPPPPPPPALTQPSPPAPVVAPPAASAPPVISGAPLLAQPLTAGLATWSGSPTRYGYQWQDCNASGGACSSIAGAQTASYTVTAGDVGHTIRVIEAAANAGGTGKPVVSAASAVVQAAPTAGYWLMTYYGNVMQSPGAQWFGSALRARESTITGFAATPSRHGYWLVDTSGRVFAYGNAGLIRFHRYGYPVRGIVAARRGAWLFTAAGNVWAVGGAPWYGSPRHGLSSPIAGMAATPDGRGYWLVTLAGQVYSFGDAPQLPAATVSARVRGIVAARGHGVWVYTIAGQVVSLGGAPTFSQAPPPATTPIVGLARTADGGGYWLVDETGQVFPYGDAATFRLAVRAHPITGIGS